MPPRSETSNPHPYRPWQIRILVATWLSYAGYYFCRKAFYIVKAPMGDTLGLTTNDLANPAQIVVLPTPPFPAIAHFIIGSRLDANLQPPSLTMADQQRNNHDRIIQTMT